MVRYIQEDTQFTGSDGRQHLMRKGDRVAMYPPAIHKDPEIFENPLVSYPSLPFINELIAYANEQLTHSALKPRPLYYNNVSLSYVYRNSNTTDSSTPNFTRTVKRSDTL